MNLNRFDGNAFDSAVSNNITDYWYPVERPQRQTPPPGEIGYTIDPNSKKQTILGLGFEIQSDSINSGNNGLSSELASVPHDLLISERKRLADDMLKGFRYCRIAGGLYWRGVSRDGKYLTPRWPEQLEELRDLLSRAGVEGVSLEYWSPPPYWKANRRFEGSPRDRPPDSENMLRCFSTAWANDQEYRGDTDRFLHDFADACVKDIATLEATGIPVSMWGLNNEPQVNTAYSSCRYTVDQWARVFAAVAPRVRDRYPRIAILADCADHTADYLRHLEELYPETAELVTYIVLHTIGFRSDTVLPVVESVRNRLRLKRPVFQNEYEYLVGPTSPDRCLNTVNNILNWFQLVGAPIWFWIHALKPLTNSEASGYSLGFWMPAGGVSDAIRSTLRSDLAELPPAHWVWNSHNWHALAGFLRHMPWNSVVVSVRESKQDDDARVLATARPDGRLVVAVSNHTTAALTVRLDSGLTRASFTGYRYTPDDGGPDFRGQPIGSSGGPSWTSTLPDRSWEFWVQEGTEGE